MKNTLDEDFQTFVEYHFPREARRPLARIAHLIRLLHQDSPDAIEIADELASYVRGHVHRELGVECKMCGGEGMRTYGSGSTWRGGMGVASCTDEWLIYKRLMEQVMADAFSRYYDEPKVKK